MCKHIYVMTHPYSSLIKIGASKDTASRAQTLGTSCGAVLEVVYESLCTPLWADFERYILRHFADYNTRGEWFNLAPEVAIEYIKQLEHDFNTGVIIDLLEEFREPVPPIQNITRLNPLEKYYKVTDLIFRDQQYHYFMYYKHVNVTELLKTSDLPLLKKIVTKLGSRVQPHSYESAKKS